MLTISYHKFTDEDREKAQRIDLADFLRSQGEKVTKVGREYIWQDGAEKISINGNVWFNHYEQEGGDAISFVQKYYLYRSIIIKTSMKRSTSYSEGRQQQFIIRMLCLRRSLKGYLNYLNRTIITIE